MSLSMGKPPSLDAPRSTPLSSQGANHATLGFHENKTSGKIYAVEPTLSTETDDKTGAVHERVRLNDVRGGSRLIRKSELSEKYEPVREPTAQRWWDEEVSKIPELDHRGLHVIGGSIMPVWNVLQGGAHGLKTVRVKTDDGQRIIGARIGGEAINRVLRGLGAVGNVNLTPEDVQKTVMEDGETLDLAGDMQLRRATLSGEKRMEVLKVPYTQEKTVQSFGVTKEYIQHRPRYFVNLYDEAALPRLLKQYARMYINQYAGIPTRTVFDDWIARKVHSNGLLRAIVPDPGLTAEKISMAATSLQFMAKIGLNFFTPIQHMMQLSGILAKAGIFRTTHGAMIYLGSRALPNAINPWVRELVRLRQSGVLDSLTNPIERPTTNKLTKKAGDALGFFLDQALDMNAGTGFFAAYFKARAEGKNVQEATDLGRDMVRMTRYFQGRLDAPIMSRTPWLRPVYQFKTFSLKAFEMFFHNMSHTERLKYLLWTVAIGGPASLGISSLMHTFMPDSQYTAQLDSWQETANLAAFLQMPRLAKAVGIWQWPGSEEVTSPYRDWWKNMAEYVAGPTINGIVGTLHAAGVEGLNLNDEEANERAWKLTMELMRDWMPAGTALRRLGQAMQQGQNTEDQLRILFAAYTRDNPANPGLIQKISEQLGIEKLIPDILPDNVEVR